MTNPNTTRPASRKTKSYALRRPKITSTVRAWLSHNGRLGGLATNRKRAKEHQA